MSKSAKIAWTQPAIDAEIEAVMNRMAAHASEADAAAELEREITRWSDEGTSEGRFKAVARGLVLLRRQVRDRSFPRATIEKLTELLSAMLKVEGIETSTSKLSHLHGELAGARAVVLQGRGAHHEAAWMAFEGDRLAMRSADEAAEGGRLLVMASTALRLGQARLALEIYNVAAGVPGPVRTEALAGVVDGLWLSGDSAGARHLAKELLDDPATEASMRVRLGWRKEVMSFVESGDGASLIRGTAKDEPYYRPEYLVDLTLLFKSVKSRALLDQCLKPRTVKRVFSEETAAGRGDLHFSLKYLEALGDAYDATLPLDTRMAGLEAVYAGRKELRSVERELLLLAALGRCLARLRQDAFAALVIGEYRSLSLNLSAGASPDVLGVVSDLLDRSWYRTSDKEEAEGVDQRLISHVPTGRLVRSLRLGKMSAQIAGEVLTGRLRKVLASKAEKARLQALATERIGRIMAENLGQMRGALVKLGQFLSISQAAIPLPMRQALSNLQSAAPEAPYSLMREVFVKEFGKAPEEVFAAWDPTPLAAASIGQVYRAKTFEGDDVCVKIQFPDIVRCIEDDVANLGILLPFGRIFGPNVDFAGLLEEVRTMILAECDYVAEIKHQKQMQQILKGHPVLRVPDVLDAYCRPRVVATRFVDGSAFKEFKLTATQEEKQHAANVIFSAFLRTFIEHGHVNVDPNPGNFLFKDGLIHLIDFGCVKVWSETFRASWVGIFRAVIRNDKDMMRRHLSELDMIADQDKYDTQFVVDSARQVFVPKAAVPMPIVPTEVRDFMHREVTDNPNSRYSRVHPDSMFLYRIIWGLFSLMAELEVKDEWRGIFEELVEGAEGLRQAS